MKSKKKKARSSLWTTPVDPDIKIHVDKSVIAEKQKTARLRMSMRELRECIEYVDKRQPCDELKAAMWHIDTVLDATKDDDNGE